MHTARLPAISTNDHRTDLPSRQSPGLSAVRLFAGLGLVGVPVAGAFATTAIDSMATETQLMLAGGFITLGFGSLVALVTHHRPADRALTR